MTDLDKIKVGFALALLGVLFTLNPIINQNIQFSFFLFGISLSIKLAFLILGVLLGSSVFFYATARIDDSFPFQLIKKAGHIAYSAGLLIPPFYILLFLVSVLTDFVSGITDSKFLTDVFNFLSAVVVIGFVITFVFLLFRKFVNMERDEKVREYSEREIELLRRAKELFDKEYYDISLSESWKTIEIALKKAFVSRNISFNNNPIRMVKIALEKKMLTNNQAEELFGIRKLRNAAAHSDMNVSIDDAQNALDAADKILTSLNEKTEQCYYCNKEYPLSEMENHEKTGASVCKECIKTHPGWREELSSLGN